MIQQETRLVVADNTGAKELLCIRVMGSSNKKFAAVGDEIPLISQKPYIGNWVEIILHSEKDGLFKELKIRDDLTSSIIEKDLWVKKGDKVSTFRGANDSIGTLVMNASSEQGQSEMLLSIPQWLSIETC